MDKAKTAQKYGKTRRRRGENTANVRKNTEKSVKIGENAGVSRDFFDFLGGDGIFCAFVRRFSRLFVRFFLFRAGIPCFFALSPSSFYLFFLSMGLKFAIFLCLSSFFCCQRLLFVDKRCFFLIFYEKRRKQAKNRQNFGEFVLFFAFSLSSLDFLAYFLGVFLLVFFDFRGKQVLSGVFLRLFLYFLAELSPFLSVLSLLRLLIFCRAKNGNF